MLEAFSLFLTKRLESSKKKELKHDQLLHTPFFMACLVIDHEFRHNVVKVAVDLQTTLTML